MPEEDPVCSCVEKINFFKKMYISNLEHLFTFCSFMVNCSQRGNRCSIFTPGSDRSAIKNEKEKCNVKRTRQFWII